MSNMNDPNPSPMLDATAELIGECENDLISLKEARAAGRVPAWLPPVTNLDDAIITMEDLIADLKRKLVLEALLRGILN